MGRGSKAWRLAAAGVGTLISATGFAQTETATAVETIVVTARKVAENLQSVPISITALSGDSLERQSVSSLADVQGQVPNLVLQTAASEPQALTLSIRGQRQNDILLTVDPSVGIYVDNLYYPRTLGLRSALVDIARLEVLRGPQGTLYGRNTTGGALSLYTNDPVTDAAGGSLEANYENYDAWELVGIANLPLSDTIAFRGVAQHSERDGYGRDGAGRELNNEDTTYLRGKLKATLGEHWTAVLSGSYQESDNGGSIVKVVGLLPATATAPAGGNATTAIARQLFGTATPTLAQRNQAAELLASYIGGDPYRSYGTTPSSSSFESYSAGLDLTYEINAALSVRSITGYQHLDRFNESDVDGTPWAVLEVVRETKSEYASQELQLLGSADTYNWVVGAYFGHESGEEYSPSRALGAVLPAINDADITNDTYAVFAQGTWEFIPTWRATVGARYSMDERELISSNANAQGCVVPDYGVTRVLVGGGAGSRCPRRFAEDFSDPSWLVSFDHQFSDDLLGYAKVARGYRTGGINLRGSLTAETFSSFDPETVTEYEIGFKSELFDRLLRLNLAVYYDDYKDIQRSSTVSTGSGPQTFLSNAAEGSIQGFELETLLRLTSNFSISASAGLTDAEYKDFTDLTGDRTHESFGVPKWTASASARYVHPLTFGELAVQADYSWRSEVELVPETPSVEQVTQGDNGLLNARISMELDAWDTEVALYGRNLTDEVYYDIAGNLERSIGLNYVMTGAPRTYGLSIKKRFGKI